MVLWPLILGLQLLLPATVLGYAPRKEYESAYFLKDQEYGLSYVEGLGDYIYNPKHVSPIVLQRDVNSYYGLNLDGFFIQTDSDSDSLRQMSFTLLPDSCVRTPNKPYKSCICFTADGSSAMVNNPNCGKVTALSVCYDGGHLFFNGKKGLPTNNFLVDWQEGRIHYANGVQSAVSGSMIVNVATSYFWLNEKATQNSAVKGIRVFPSYVSDSQLGDKKAPPCSSYTFTGGLFVGHLVGNDLQTTDRINGTAIKFDAKPSEEIKVPSCDRLVKSCKHQCDVTKALNAASCPAISKAILFGAGVASVGAAYL